jgi:hypothetical protein
VDNPVQTECSTGLRNHINQNYVVVQPKTFILAECVELLRSSLWEGAYYSIPRATLHLHGVIHVKVLRTWETQAKNIIFILTFRERLLDI